MEYLYSYHIPKLHNKLQYARSRKIAVSISKAAVLVSARKPRHRFVAMSIAINAKATKDK